ncbi:hypothetical protein [Desertivibrio insolitus]|uniref:hypothetical protein n=1 Tax=Herbiconiux sp. SYSU D00978 TaxID=2812562 RepID=UPI001A96C803|nr:hypothetical protein [Herbiconiux sp. SYSU D00978]
MSTANLAFTLPAPEVPAEEQRTRHIEVVPSRSQRRARPRLVYAVTAVVGVVGVLFGQLGLSILLADNTYEISSLRSEQQQLTRDEAALSEKLNVLSSPQHLSDEAVALGMVSDASPVFFDLATGAVLGEATPAEGDVERQFESGLTPNEALAGIPVGAAAAEQQQQQPTQPVVAEETDAAASAPVPAAPAQNAEEAPADSLPAPQTH